MQERKPIELIHIVDDLDAKAIEKGYIEDTRNTNEQQFISINNINALAERYHFTPKVNQTYVYDISSQSYILFDNDIEKHFSENKLEAYITIFGYMGATSVEGKITDLTKRKKEADVNGGFTYKMVKADIEWKKQMQEDFSKTIEISRNFGRKNIKSYEEVKNYLQERGLINDAKLRSRLEELRISDNQLLSGTYEHKAILTHNLQSALNIAANLSATPFFSGNVGFKNRCSQYTEVHSELRVVFD